ncbi:MAG: hypothetical protein A2V70_06230 [Planctomycetes bacterium RBG_13_63_9]|nr:MAG: hypothetical protein A2V70_06230 [Planctomycetes bacterium RBG_13_63_9]
MSRPRIYISGPLSSSGNERENVARAVAVARQLIDLGFAPFCPHLSWYLDPAGEIPHDTWMEVDLPWVAVADAVLRIPGESLGADIEVDHARAVGVPVLGTIGELVELFTDLEGGSDETFYDRQLGERYCDRRGRDCCRRDACVGADSEPAAGSSAARQDAAVA